MKITSLALAVSASLAATAVYAGDNHEKTSDAAAVQIETDKLVDGRRAGYWMSAAIMGNMFGVVESGGDVKGLAFSARVLSGWAKALPGMFPAGAVNEKSTALPTVWSDREGFEATAKLYQDRTAKLAEIAKTGDKDAFKTQWVQVRQTCETCHDTYRKEREKQGN